MAIFPTPLFVAILVLVAAIASAAAGLAPTKGKAEEREARLAAATAGRLEVGQKEEADERRQPGGRYGQRSWQWHHHHQAMLARRTAPVQHQQHPQQPQQRQQRHLSLVRRGARFPRRSKADKAGNIPYYKRLWELYPDRIPSPGTYFDECLYNYMTFVSLKLVFFFLFLCAFLPSFARL